MGGGFNNCYLCSRCCPDVAQSFQIATLRMQSLRMDDESSRRPNLERLRYLSLRGASVPRILVVAGAAVEAVCGNPRLRDCVRQSTAKNGDCHPHQSPQNNRNSCLQDTTRLLMISVRVKISVQAAILDTYMYCTANCVCDAADRSRYHCNRPPESPRI